ncbi:glycosyl hydrolase 2 galactose-binding domain-containing protein [Pinisolibacter aquiterrae]|uniref:glycosyl hydrolase 2 galactose-binding domain-containing protein n=1 Tax=Pinisolibacter aquiterrae TaxID=2815579 RepID=UPI001C3CCD28|nr:glycoside hydrolase family 2 protein [Pinisolibacter aquiterrae]MCC8233950.1 glycoside hydrolase family 2 protein [Pinisolibacter aquiterrae]
MTARPFETAVALDAGWSLTSTPARAHAGPADLPPDAERLVAAVPGTVAATLAAHGRWSLDAPAALHDRDHWYRRRLDVAGRRILRFEGLATIAQVFLDGREILASTSMFLAHEVEVDLVGGEELAIVFRSLAAHLDGVKPKRARWRSTLVPDQRLRAVRTTLLGHMPGWCPPVDVVGPFRPVLLIDPAEARLRDVHLRADYDGIDGRLEARIDPAPGVSLDGAVVRCAGCEAPLVAGPDGGLVARLALAGIAPWWPATHGEPRLHDVVLDVAGRRLPLGRVGFRRLTVDRDADGKGFGITVNGVPVFARGVVRTPSDLVGLAGDREALAPDLDRLVAAGVNMVRVAGIGAYESAAFHDLCDERGLLVWQDLMFANFDYPAADPAFVDLCRREAEQVLTRLAASPSLTIVCGGSEVTQQAAMMGLPPAAWGNALFDEILPEIAARLAPSVPWLRSTPDGGAMPFRVDEGVGHYFGVGAYRRPLDDARRAKVRFAAECLAFAHVPDPVSLATALPVPPVQHPKWKARVPRDTGAAWDFEDTRIHYEAAVFGVDPHALRQEDPARYLDLARATTAHVVEETIREFRRPGSTTRGALVLLHRDPWFGAGWGLVDALGVPKSSFHALARASRPVAVILSDEGVNGLDVHLSNETAAPVSGRLDLVALADGARPAVAGSREVEIPARGALTLAATDLFGAFFDTTRAYRFGPPAHDATHARLTGPDGEVLAEAFHFPLGRTATRRACGLIARVEGGEGAWRLVVATSVLATSVVIVDENFLAEDDGFHLAPGERSLALRPRPGADPAAPPEGEVRAIDAVEVARYRA